MRGAVHDLRRRPDARGHEQAGARLAVVVLASRFSHLSQWLVVPTSTSAREFAFRPRIGVAGITTLALCDALVAVDPQARLGDQVDHLAPEEIDEIDTALAVLLDLDHPWIGRVP